MKMNNLLKDVSIIKKNKRSIITFAAVALLVIAGSLIYSFRYDIMFSTGKSAKPEVVYKFDESKQNTAYPYGDNIIVVNNEEIIGVDKDGKEIFNLPAQTSSPLVKTAGQYIILADCGGTEVYIINDGEIVNNFSAENTIINCSINEKGRAVLVTNETSYRNVITAYNTRGEEVYKWKNSDFYVTDAVMSYDGSRLAATYISTDSRKLTGGVIMVDVRQESVLGNVAYENCVFPYVAFNGDNSATAVGDTLMVGVSKKGTEEWKVEYDGNKLQTFAFREGDGTILAFENNANNSTLVSYDKNGKKQGTNRLNFSVLNLDMRSGLTLVTGTDRAIAVDMKCRQRVQVLFDQEFKAGWFKDNKSMIYLVNGSNIETVKL